MLTRRAFAGSLGALGVLAGSPALAQTAAPLHAGVTSDDGYEAWFAQDLGFFAKVGLNVDSQLFNNGVAAGAALTGGPRSVACGNVVTVAQARDHGSRSPSSHLRSFMSMRTRTTR